MKVQVLKWKWIGCGMTLALWILSGVALADEQNRSFSRLSQVDLETRALQQVASRTGEPFQALAIANYALAQYPVSGQSAHHFKVLSRHSTEIYGVLLDDQGRELNAERLQAAEQEAYFARSGRLEISLAEHLASTYPNEPVEVIIWLKEPTYMPLPSPDPAAPMTLDDLEVYYQQVDAHRAAFVQSVVAPVVARFRAAGLEPVTNAYAPVIAMELPAWLIEELSRDTLNWAEIDRIYLSGRPEPELDISRRTIFADVVHNRGITGSGVKVGMVEAISTGETGRVAALYGNPNLQDDPRENPFLFNTVFVTSHPLGETAAGAHATGVAGVIGSTEPTVRGIAPNVQLWTGAGSARTAGVGNSPQCQAASSAAVTWGAVALNLSWGSGDTGRIEADDRFYDSLVLNNRRSVVKSAGNRGNIVGNRYVTTPGLAYNVIAVGNFDDRNTVNWDDDIMRVTSSYWDPVSTHNDREKPELVAPGTNIRSTSTAAPWNNYTETGTSFAAPHVTGTIALMTQSVPFMGTAPEVVKAILMCDAVNNIEEDRQLSDRDGAGAIVANMVEQHIRGVGGSGWATGFHNSDCTAWNDIPLGLLNGNQRVRAAIVWLQNPAGPGYPNEPTVDYDLQLVRQGDNAVIASAASFDNTFEVLDWTLAPTEMGQYLLRVRVFRCNGHPVVRAYAYWSGKFGNAFVTVPNVAGRLCETVPLVADLRDVATRNPIANQPLTFRVNNVVVGTVNTDANGRAALNYPIPENLGLGAKPILVEFAGNTTYNESSGLGTLTVSKGNTALNVPNQAGQRGQVVQLRATLTCVGDNSPLRNKNLTFKVDGNVVGNAMTNNAGVATVNYTIPNNATVGAHPIRVEFAGDALYNATSNTAILAVNQVLLQGIITPLDLSISPGGLRARIVVTRGAQTETFNRTLGPNGEYSVLTSLTGNNGTVSAVINNGTWLRQRRAVDLNGVVTKDFVLTNGDAVSDQLVDDNDLAAVIFNFGSSGPDGDLDRDGSVDDADLVIAVFAFGQQGDPE